MNNLDKIPCVPKTCVDAESLFPNFNVEHVAENEVMISCSEENSLIGASKVPFQESLTFKCSLSSGKLPAWKVENVPFKDSYDIEFECRQKDKCYTQPKTFNNKILINDYEHQVYNNGTKFSFYCPSKKTGKTLDHKPIIYQSNIFTKTPNPIELEILCRGCF